MKKRLFSKASVTVVMTLSLFSCSHQSALSSVGTNRSPQNVNSSEDDWYGRFGACLVSPDNHDYEDKWTGYHEAIQKKVRINIGHYDQMPVSKDVRDFIANLSAIAPLLVSWDAIKTSSWATHMFRDKNFVELTSSPAFVYALRDPNFVENNQDPLFEDNYSDPDFKKNFDVILDVIRRQKTALSYFGSKKLVFVDLHGLTSALRLAKFFQLPDTVDTLNYVPFMKDIPLPAKPQGSTDVFGSAYWDILQTSIASFLENFPTGQDELDHLVSPDETIPYDDYVVSSHAKDAQTQMTRTVLGNEYQVGVRELTAIDGVARTLWGEAASCDVGKDVHGYSAVGLVMANRTVAVQNSLNEKASVRKTNQAIELQDVSIFMNADAKDTLKGFVPARSLGQADFGRRGSTQLPASQIVSRPAQFSCWNGYNTHTQRLSTIASLPEGMPDLEYTFKTPKPANDEHELVNVLCPTINANVHKHDGMVGWDRNFPNSFDASWRSAVDEASLIVLDPDRYKELYSFNPAPNSAPLFYTNGGIVLPGLPVITVDGMEYKDPDTGKTESFSGGTSCNRLKVFTARSRTVYGVTP